MKKYYVVWKGHKPGIYSSWEDCKKQTDKFSGAKFKSFPSKDEAEKAWQEKESPAPTEEMEITLNKLVTELRIYRLRHPK